MAVNKKLTNKGIRWKVDVTENLANGKQKRHKATFEDQTEALIYEKQLKQALLKLRNYPCFNLSNVDGESS